MRSGLKSAVPLVAACVALGAGPVRAEESCADALVVSTYNRFDQSSTDYRLASFVTENAYNEVKKNGGGSAVIYGVPVGGNYSDFRNSVQQRMNRLNVSLSQSQASNVMWSGLDPNGANAYVECVRSKKFSKGGLHLAVRSATKSELTIWASWRPTGTEGAAAPEWGWNGDGKAALPTSLLPGDRTIILPRPKDQRILAVNFQGHTDSLVIEPYPELPAIVAKPVEYVDELRQYKGGSVAAFSRNWSAPSTFCTPDMPEGWTIAKVVYRLESDTERGTCGAWTECSGAEADTSKKACRTLKVQGHTGGRYSGIGRSTPVFDVTWRRPRD